MLLVAYHTPAAASVPLVARIQISRIAILDYAITHLAT